MLRGELDLPLTFSQLAASFRNLRPGSGRVTAGGSWERLEFVWLTYTIPMNRLNKLKREKILAIE